MDNGVGFDIHNARFSNEGGNGIMNMKKRAEVLKGKLLITSDQSQGTLVQLEIPID